MQICERDTALPTVTRRRALRSVDHKTQPIRRPLRIRRKEVDRRDCTLHFVSIKGSFGDYTLPLTFAPFIPFTASMRVVLLALRVVATIRRHDRR